MRNVFYSKRNIAILSILLFIGLAISLFIPPFKSEFPNIVKIKDGLTLKEVSDLLAENHIISSPTVFNILIILGPGDKNIISGDYVFREKLNIFEVAKKVTTGSYGLEKIRITVPEGVTVLQMSELFEQYLVNFDKGRFIELALSKEGYLFPDTYFFQENANEDDVVVLLEKTFQEKIVKELDEELKSSPFTIEEIVIMASIIQREATRDTMQDISDILWKRISLEMPLQVDAPFVYSIGKGSFDLTLKDLRTENPYNTYINAGLPPTPIANPGIDAIKAAINPEDTEYLFFLTGHDGEMYYAENFNKHKENKRNFLY